MHTLILKPGQLALKDLHEVWQSPVTIKLADDCFGAIKNAAKVVTETAATGSPVYGVNTGFGLLANTHIPSSQLHELQHRIVLSHAAGVGPLLADNIVRLILLLKINSLARGYSGVQLETIEALIALLNAGLYPCIPAKGSVGASGDLAPLAHLSAILLGYGECRLNGERIPALEALRVIGLKPFKLAPKEGLALLNGTQVSTALALNGLFAFENVFTAAVVAGALSVDAAAGSDTPFDPRIQEIRGQIGQITLAKIYRDLLAGSGVREAHRQCNRVQDPYSLRCQPQVMGACLDYLSFAAQKLLIEANGVSDNPLIFSDTHEILSGGNFHAEPVALAADTLAICIAEVGNISERRTALLMDPHQNCGLPAFLAQDPGLNSGFMLPHVTASALASENKSLAHPASVDTIPTSANQEDHVSMATYGARRLGEMVDNAANIIAIELLAACQGVELRKPLVTSLQLQKVLSLIRSKVAFYAQDRFIAPDIAAIRALVQDGEFKQFVPDLRELTCKTP